jgi:hypothetical protein
MPRLSILLETDNIYKKGIGAGPAAGGLASRASDERARE